MCLITVSIGKAYLVASLDTAMCDQDVSNIIYAILAHVEMKR